MVSVTSPLQQTDVQAFARERPQTLLALEALVHELVRTGSVHDVAVLTTARRTLARLHTTPQSFATSENAPVPDEEVDPPLEAAAFVAAACIRDAAAAPPPHPEPAVADAEVAKAAGRLFSARAFAFENGQVEAYEIDDSMSASFESGAAPPSYVPGDSVLMATERALTEPSLLNPLRSSRSKGRRKRAKAPGSVAVQAPAVGRQPGLPSSVEAVRRRGSLGGSDAGSEMAGSAPATPMKSRQGSGDLSDSHNGAAPGGAAGNLTPRTQRTYATAEPGPADHDHDEQCLHAYGMWSSMLSHICGASCDHDPPHTSHAGGSGAETAALLADMPTGAPPDMPMGAPPPADAASAAAPAAAAEDAQ
eukprot:TRINITY_DN55739_c0_g1_i1.p1 TRINITY_DN55739_c0_g1~~TRINITY_DN55739_c0_g1_i1.p1  ORF type:complete len:363 (-),score=48.33 TRINITY_DN55739_c0_g1_i1:460-1548(-)